MSARKPIAKARATSLIIRLGTRRWLNRMRSRLRRPKKKDKTGKSSALGSRVPREEPSTSKRKGTGRKPSKNLVLFGFLALIFAWGGWVQVVPAVRSAALTGTDAVVVSRWVSLMAESAASNPSNDPAVRAASVESVIKALQNDSSASPAELTARAEELIEIARQSGKKRFVPDKDIAVSSLEAFLPSDLLRSRQGQNLRFAVLLAALFIILSTLAYAAVDLAKPEWDLEWLWTTPAPAQSIIWSRFFEYALLNPMAWFVAGPMFLAAFLLRLNIWIALPLSVLSVLFISALAGAVRLLAEFVLRGRLRFAKNLQALCSISCIGSFFAFVVAGNSMPLPSWFESGAGLAAPLAYFVGLPLLALDGPKGLWIGVGLTILAGVATASLAVGISARSTASGLLSRTNLHQGVRRARVNGKDQEGFLHGIIGKDLRLLLRDRNILVQILIVPGFVFGMQLIFNRGMASAIASDPRHAAAAAFGIGAYMLMFCATGVLSAEAGSLWILYTTPQRIDDILRRKTKLWAGLAAVYTLLCFTVLSLTGTRFELDNAPHVAIAMLAVALCAYLAAAIGSMGADPTNPEPTRRVTPWAMYAYMLLSTLAARALYAPSWWEKSATFFFLTLLAAALWQKLRDRIPYLLDPTEAPPPKLSLSDGMVATFAFLVLSGVLTGLFCMKSGFQTSKLLAAYATAGGIVVTLSWIVLGTRVSGFARTIGLVGDPSTPWRKTRALLLGLVGGIVSGALGLSYVRLLASWPALREAMQAIDPRDELLTQSGAVSFSLLAVVAAPLVEEFLFRGLAFRGLQRSTSPALAVLLSAALFAFVHPLMSLPAVFVLGIVTALVFRRSGLLLAPILCHAVYNAIIVADKYLNS